MEFVQLLEVCVQLDELVNLELLRKGIYRVDLRVESASASGQRATAYSSFAAPSRLTSVSRGVVCEGSDAASEAGGIGVAAAERERERDRERAQRRGSSTHGQSSTAGKDGAPAEDGETCYSSRSVYLRYTDEAFDLNEGAVFRLELPVQAAPSLAKPLAGSSGDVDNVRSNGNGNSNSNSIVDGTGGATGRESGGSGDDKAIVKRSNHSSTTSASGSNRGSDVVLRVRLMRADAAVVDHDAAASGAAVARRSSQTGGGASSSSSSSEGASDDHIRVALPEAPVVRRTSAFSKVAEAEVHLPRAADGLHAFVPVIFDPMNLALVTLTVHTALVGAQSHELAAPADPELEEAAAYIGLVDGNCVDASVDGETAGRHRAQASGNNAGASTVLSRFSDSGSDDDAAQASSRSREPEPDVAGSTRALPAPPTRSAPLVIRDPGAPIDHGGGAAGGGAAPWASSTRAARGSAAAEAGDSSVSLLRLATNVKAVTAEAVSIVKGMNATTTTVRLRALAQRWLPAGVAEALVPETSSQLHAGGAQLGAEREDARASDRGALISSPPLSEAEALFPGWHHHCAQARAARRAMIILLAHQRKAADAAVEAAVRNGVPPPTSRPPSPSVMQSQVPRADGDYLKPFGLGGSDADAAHALLVGPLVAAYQQLASAIAHVHSLSGRRASHASDTISSSGAAPAAPAPLHTAPAQRFSHETRRKARRKFWALCQSDGAVSDTDSVEARGSSAALLQDAPALPPCANTYDASGAVEAGTTPSSDPQPRNASLRDGFANLVTLRGGARGDVASGGTLPFRQRAARCLAAEDPDALARAVVTEAEYVGSHVAVLWRQLQSLVVRQRTVIIHDLQARYRAAALHHLRAGVHVRVLAISALTGMGNAAAPPTIVTPAPRAPLDPALRVVNEALTVTATRYQLPRHAGSPHGTPMRVQGQAQPTSRTQAQRHTSDDDGNFAHIAAKPIDVAGRPSVECETSEAAGVPGHAGAEPSIAASRATRLLSSAVAAAAASESSSPAGLPAGLVSPLPVGGIMSSEFAPSGAVVAEDSVADSIPGAAHTAESPGAAPQRPARFATLRPLQSRLPESSSLAPPDVAGEGVAVSTPPSASSGNNEALARTGSAACSHAATAVGSEGGPSPRADAGDECGFGRSCSTEQSYSLSDLYAAAAAPPPPRTAPYASGGRGGWQAGMSPHAHVVLFFNGLGGSTHDTRVVRSHLKLHHPYIFCYVTATNQGKATEGDLIETGARVAAEVHEYLAQRLPEEGVTIGRLSIIAFSLGGIVARLVLRHPLITPFLRHAHAFISIATPHMGLLYSQSHIFNAGIYLFRQWKGSVSLAQLALQDEPATGPQGVRDCLLYLLAAGWDDRGEPAAAEIDRTRMQSAQYVPNGSASAAAGSSIRTGGGIAGDLSAAVSDGAVPQQPDDRTSAHSRTGPGDAADAPFAASQAAGSLPAIKPQPVPATLAALRRHRYSSVPNGAIFAKFRRVVLIASQQDSYAPYTSCMAQFTEAAVADSRNGAAYGEMLQGFFAGLRGRAYYASPADKSTAVSSQDTLSSAGGRGLPPRHAIQRTEKPAIQHQPAHDGVPLPVEPSATECVVMRLDVRFNHLASALLRRPTVDSVLGREAHVAFLENECMAALLALSLGHVWDGLTPDVLSGHN